MREGRLLITQGCLRVGALRALEIEELTKVLNGKDEDKFVSIRVWFDGERATLSYLAWLVFSSNTVCCLHFQGRKASVFDIEGYTIPQGGRVRLSQWHKVDQAKCQGIAA